MVRVSELPRLLPAMLCRGTQHNLLMTFAPYFYFNLRRRAVSRTYAPFLSEYQLRIPCRIPDCVTMVYNDILLPSLTLINLLKDVFAS